MIRSLKTLVLLALLAAPAAAAELVRGDLAQLDWRPVAQTLLAIGLLILLARGTAGDERDARVRTRGRGGCSSFSSGSW